MALGSRNWNKFLATRRWTGNVWPPFWWWSTKEASRCFPTCWGISSLFHPEQQAAVVVSMQWSRSTQMIPEKPKQGRFCIEIGLDKKQKQVNIEVTSTEVAFVGQNEERREAIWLNNAVPRWILSFRRSMSSLVKFILPPPTTHKKGAWAESPLYSKGLFGFVSVFRAFGLALNVPLIFRTNTKN